MNYLAELNQQQKEAVLHSSGPLLIIAGAGAGKTKTIVTRIAKLIESGVPPEAILAITFTNKAASEIRDRLEKMLAAGKRRFDPDRFNPNRPLATTFHSLGVFILRHEAAKIGLSRHFTILDHDDSLTKIKETMRSAGLDQKQFEPRKILGAISRLKSEGVNHLEYEIDGGHWSRIVGDIWRRYEAILTKDKALDFDDLLLKTARLFERRPEILKNYQDRWTHIHIDEYQDTNGIQYRLSKLLAGDRQNLCVVGDIDQSIYSWRGADFTNILNFERDYPAAKVVVLEENYRSSKTILAAADRIIKKNKNRKEKKLFTKNADGQPISFYQANDEVDEALYVASKVGEMIAGGLPASKIAVLYRANFQSRALEEAFILTNIPYQVLGIRFFERKEVKDIISYIKAALNPNDWASVKRIINVPRRGIGKITLAKMAAGQEADLPPKMRGKITAFKNLLAIIRKNILAGDQKTSAIIKLIIEQTGLAKELRRGGEDDLERLENIRELATLAAKYDGWPAEAGVLRLLDEVVLTSEQDTLKEELKAVRLMTVHASKGLEFDVVFIVGLEDKLFPHDPVFSDHDNRDEEEERRLFYVAITRARHKLFLTYAATRTIYGSKQINLPSEFLLDLDQNLLATDGNNYFAHQKIINY